MLNPRFSRSLSATSKHFFSVRRTRFVASAIICTALSACGGGGKVTAPDSIGLGTNNGLSGRTSFVSTANAPLVGNARNYQSVNLSGNAAYAAMDTASASTTANTRVTTEGDIYRVLDAGKTLLNLNPYRGLQIVDLSNPTTPKILGRAAMSGTPTEMYRIGERVYVLLNSWSQYRRVQKESASSLERFNGAAIITVDISNRAAPKIIASMPVDGYLGASRMSSGGGKNALYITAQKYGSAGGESYVKSFAIDSQGILQAKSNISLGGYVQAIQASNERLMVASIDPASVKGNYWRSQVSIVDISSTEGVMIKGADVPVSGVIRQKNNMHIQGNIMRIVSAASTSAWGFIVLNGEVTRTADVITVVDLNQNNTNQISPTTTTSTSTSTSTTTAPTSNPNDNHVETFNIADISKPIAIDHDTFGTGQQLYGTTFLPDRAFFVTYLRQDPFHAFSISADGQMQEENAFVVSGWNDFFIPVQTNTRLIGVGHNDQNNRRALAISLYDITNLKNTQPLIARSEIDLSYSSSEANWDDRAFTVLENATSVVAADGKTLETGLVLLPFTGWDNSSYAYRTGVQIFSFSATTLTRRGNMLQDTQVRRSFIGDSAASIAANLGANEVSLFNIANPDAPVKKSSLPLASNYTQFVALPNVGVRYQANDFGWWGMNSAAKRTDVIEVVALNDVDGNAPIASISVPAGSKIFALGNYLSLVSSEMVGSTMRSTIKTYDLAIPANPRLLSTFVSDEIQAAYNYSIYQMADCGIVFCSNYAYANTQVIAFDKALVFVGRSGQTGSSPDGTNTNRYWSNFSFQVLNLEDVTRPSLLPKIGMASNEESIDVIKNGNSLWINFQKIQAQLGANGEQQSKFFIKELGLNTPGNPQLGKEINIPGQLMTIVGNQFYSIEYSLVGRDYEPSLHMSLVQNDLAYLQASINLGKKYLTGLLANENAVAVTSIDATSYRYEMALYTVPSKEFTLQSSTQFDSGLTPLALRQDKILLQDWYGLFLYDISQLKSPKVQAYFPAMGWYGSASFINKDVYLPASYYGIYQFKLDTNNLPSL